MSAAEQICATDKIAAFIDGELDAVDRSAFEAHVAGCDRCSSELLAQRQFMCELDSAMASPFDLEVPRDFARVVAVRAESDMRGVRASAEHRRAFNYCLWLGLAAFALLGVTTSQALFANARSAVAMVIGIGELLLKTVYDAAVGLMVIVRVLSGGFLTDSRLSGVTALFLVVLAISLLSFLISRYHRARLAE
jgi:anti-sigma factor RsiW